jgi:hypothetical protein
LGLKPDEGGFKAILSLSLFKGIVFRDDYDEDANGDDDENNNNNNR